MEPTILYVDLPEGLRPGLYWPAPHGAYVLVQHGLHPHERRSVVAHELAHHRRGGGVDRPGMPADWQPVAARDEAACDRDAADDLVPAATLAAWITDVTAANDDYLRDLQTGVGPRDVALAFGVTLRIAEAALVNLNRLEREATR